MKMPGFQQQARPLHHGQARSQQVLPSAIRGLAGVTLTELLVVIAIMLILMMMLAATFGVFTHRSKVDRTAEVLATIFREARNLAMKRNIPVTPIILRDVDGRYTVVYGARMLNYKGDLSRTQQPTLTWKYNPDPAQLGNPWSMYGESTVAGDLAQGAFVLLAAVPAMNLAAALNDDPLPYFEMTYMRVTPPDNAADYKNSAKYKYEMLMRGVHNTRWGEFTRTSHQRSGETTGGAGEALGMGPYTGIDGYVILDATGTMVPNPAGMSREQMQRYTISGMKLPDGISIDQIVDALSAQASSSNLEQRRVGATITAAAALSIEDKLAAGGEIMPPGFFPVFFPVFMPDGTVTPWPNQAGLQQHEYNTTALRLQGGFSLRVRDTITNDTRYVTIAFGGAEGMSKSGTAVGEDGQGSVYVSVYVGDDKIPKFGSSSSTGGPDWSTAASSSASSSSTSSSASTASNSSASSSSTASSSSSSNSTASTGTASTASTSASSASSSSSSSNSTANSSNSTANAAAATASTASSNSTASTGTASTSSTSSSAASSSSTSSSSTSSSAASSSSTSASASTSASTAASAAASAATSAAAAAASGGPGTSSGGTSSSGASGSSGGGTSSSGSGSSGGTEVL